MYYLKLWHEARNDAKLRALTDRQFRVWFNLLVFASEQPIRGNIEFESDELLAVEVAGGDVGLLDETVKRLETLRCVSSRFIGDSGVSGLRRISFLNFEKRQEGNGKTSTDRVRKHRDSKKLGRRETDETRMKRVKRVPETVETTELELELELEIKPPYVVPPRPESRGTHIRDGDDLRLTNEAIALLASDLRTEGIAQHLGREHNAAGSIMVPGWKWLRATKKIQDPGIPPGKRTWKYFLGIVRGLTEADRDEKPPAPAETKAQRRMREMSAECKRLAALDKARGEASRAD